MRVSREDHQKFTRILHILSAPARSKGPTKSRKDGNARSLVNSQPRGPHAKELRIPNKPNKSINVIGRQLTNPTMINPTATNSID